MHILKLHIVQRVFYPFVMFLTGLILLAIAFGIVKLFDLTETIGPVWYQRLVLALEVSAFGTVLTFIALSIRLVIEWFQDKDGRYFGRR